MQSFSTSTLKNTKIQTHNPSYVCCVWQCRHGNRLDYSIDRRVPLGLHARLDLHNRSTSFRVVDGTCCPDILPLDAFVKLKIWQFTIIPVLTVQTDKPWMDSVGEYSHINSNILVNHSQAINSTQHELALSTCFPFRKAKEGLVAGVSPLQSR